MPVELDFKFHRAVLHRFAAHRSGRSARGPAERAIRRPRRQLAASDRFAGLPSETNLVQHLHLWLSSERPKPDDIKPDAPSRHPRADASATG